MDVRGDHFAPDRSNLLGFRTTSTPAGKINAFCMENQRLWVNSTTELINPSRIDFCLTKRFCHRQNLMSGAIHCPGQITARPAGGQKSMPSTESKKLWGELTTAPD